MTNIVIPIKEEILCKALREGLNLCVGIRNTVKQNPTKAYLYTVKSNKRKRNYPIKAEGIISPLAEPKVTTGTLLVYPNSYRKLRKEVNWYYIESLQRVNIDFTQKAPASFCYVTELKMSKHKTVNNVTTETFGEQLSLSFNEKTTNKIVDPEFVTLMSDIADLVRGYLCKQKRRVG
jgi:hypothetical protein